jgi:hypothetical protein
MKVHFGAIKNPVTIVTTSAGYRVKSPDGCKHYMPAPAVIERNVLLGVDDGKVRMEPCSEL